MPLRLIIPGATWFGLMVLVFVTPIKQQLVYFSCVPPRSLVHAILFMGFTHIWLIACKKQLKYEDLRRNAFTTVLGAAFLIAVLSEIVVLGGGNVESINFWNLGFDIVGALLGLGSFKLLYRSCY